MQFVIFLLALIKGNLGIVGESGSGKSVSTLAIPGLLGSNVVVTGQAFYSGKDLLAVPKKIKIL